MAKDKSVPVIKSPDYGPGVKKFLEQEETKEIVQEYKETTKNLSYKKQPRPKFVEEKIKPINLLSDDVWEKLKVKKFNLIESAQELGLVDENRRLIIKETPTTTYKGLVVLLLNNFRAAKILMNEIDPKCPIKLDGDMFSFPSNMFKLLIGNYFKEDTHLIKKVNSTDIMKSLMIQLENNPVRNRTPLGLLSVTSNGLRWKIYHINSLITKFTIEELERLLCVSKQRPYYTVSQYKKLVTEINKRELEKHIIESKSPDKISTPGLESIPEELISIEASPDVSQEETSTIETSFKGTDEDIDSDQIFNIAALRKIMGKGDTIKITIEFTKSSGE